MTLVVVFRRKVVDRYELVIGADSRLSGGQYNDQAQKIFQLPRNDAIFAFAGDTQYAYPLLMQLLRSIESFPPNARGRMRLSKAKGHILRVFQQSYAAIHGLPVGEKYPADPDNYFLFAGCDWVSGTFPVWVLKFDNSVHRFVFSRVMRSKSYYFMGDDGARRYASAETDRMLRHRNTLNSINYEPLEILGNIIKDPSYPSVGGALQVGKVYPYLQSQLFQVKWPISESEESLHIAGRPLLPTEKCYWPIFDPNRGFYVPRSRYVQDSEEF